MLATERNGFPHFCRLHVVEEDDVHPVHLHQRAHLLEVISFYFNLYRWVLRLCLPNCGRKFFEILLDRQAIVLPQNRIEQTEAMVAAAAGDNSRSLQTA